MMSQTRAARSPWDSALTSPFDGDKVEEEGGKCDGGGVEKAVGDNSSLSSTASLFSTVSTFISTAGSAFPMFFNFDCSSSSSWLMKLSLLALLWEPSFRFTSCIFEAKELFLLPSLEVEELFLELEERRLTEPLEQTTSSEKETREVRPELGIDPEADDEPGMEPEVVDERRLHESEGRLSVRSTGTTTGLSFEQVAQLATLSLANRGGPWSPLQKLSFAILECPASRSRY